MPIPRRIARPGALPRAAFAVVLVAASAIFVAAYGSDPTNRFVANEEGEGRVERVPASTRPTVEVAFPRESYAPGNVAPLRVFSPARGATIRVFRVAPTFRRLVGRDVMDGPPVSRAVWLGRLRRGTVVSVRVGSWPSGVYFARITASGGRVGYAPFVVRPRRLGEHRVAVVLPTHTWQAYNFRDDDGDGTEDSWYASGNTARLGRPFLDRGVPPHFRTYDEPFLDWAVASGHSADYLADADLHRIGSGDALRRAYELLIFPGHHEYVTDREYRAVTGFRNLGGNLAFLSANNFFWKIERRGRLMVRICKWRDLGRPESALVGVQYFHNDSGERRGPWVVRNAGAARWLFQGLSLRNGSTFSSGGIEADWMTPASPRGTAVVAEIPNLYGRGLSAQMTYYERGGAKVFAAGAFTLAAGTGSNPVVRRLVANLWDYLSKP
jgi:hypothetical protein